jgi:ribokinase
MGNGPLVTVLGSLNMDISVTVPWLPRPGATVLGSAARFTPGGKGANQAVAAARLGADVRMVGCVGDDDFGRQLLAALRAEGVDADAVRTVPEVRTGLAMISVDKTGENLITVAPGANHEVGAGEVEAALGNPAHVLVICAEIPVPAIRSALARPRGAIRILNLAPAPAEAAALVAGGGEGLDWLVVNETEAGAVVNRQVDGLADAAQAAAALVAAGPRHVVVTAGAHGAVLAGPGAAETIPGPAETIPGAAGTIPGAAGTIPGAAETIPAFRVEAVDTVGAGDTFVGALAVALAAGVPAAEAVRAAAAAGATAATRPGAQAGMPRPADILAVTGLTWPVRLPFTSRPTGKMKFRGQA